MAGMYSLMFYGGLAMAIMMLIASVTLFVMLKIPKVIGDLTGTNEKKRINEMRADKVTTSHAASRERSKYYNQNTGKIKAKETSANPSNNQETVSAAKEAASAGEETAKESEKTKAASKKRYAPTPKYDTMVLTGELKDLSAQPKETYTAVYDEATEKEYDDFDDYDEPTDILTEENAEDNVSDTFTSDENNYENDAPTDVLTAATEDSYATEEAGDYAEDAPTDVLTAATEDSYATEETGDYAEDAPTDVLTPEGFGVYDAPTDVLTDEMEASMDLPTDVLRTSNIKVIYDVLVTHTDETL